MSGTSMDGLDIAYCSFRFEQGIWSWDIIESETIPYPDEWVHRLKGIMELPGDALSIVNIELGAYFGQCLLDFMQKYGIRPDLIASHGHTVYHQPEHRLTLQIGAGTEIFAVCQVPVACDFRTLDMALGGQGAPLVPIGDQLLFGEYDACLNLGGIANISYEQQGDRLAFDICPCNMTLNWLAGREGLSYDEDGQLAASGRIETQTLEALNQLDYYSQPSPKSLGMEYVREAIFPILSQKSTADMLRTSVAHTVEQILIEVHKIRKTSPRVLVTGGGALNSFLVGQLREAIGSDGEFVIPDRRIIDYKEALIFAFLGILRMQGETNVLASVTGARMDSSSGVIYG